jgi:hypothetical protein
MSRANACASCAHHLVRNENACASFALVISSATPLLLPIVIPTEASLRATWRDLGNKEPASHFPAGGPACTTDCRDPSTSFVPHSARDDMSESWSCSARDDRGLWQARLARDDRDEWRARFALHDKRERQARFPRDDDDMRPKRDDGEKDNVGLRRARGAQPEPVERGRDDRGMCWACVGRGPGREESRGTSAQSLGPRTEGHASAKVAGSILTNSGLGFGRARPTGSGSQVQPCSSSVSS